MYINIASGGALVCAALLYILAPAVIAGTSDCKDLRGPEFTNVIQGQLSVAESVDSQRPINIAYYYRTGKQTARTPSSPLMVINGGPGVGSHDMMRMMLANKHLKHLTMVFIDQRGTGCSTPYPQLTSNTINDSHHWGSTAIVNDAEALRKTLFPDSQWRLFGHSYGGLIAYRYISLFPQALESVAIFGYSPTYAPIDWLYHQTVFIQQQSAFYLQEYPNDKQILAALRKQIEPDTCLQLKDFEICGDAMLDALGHYLAYQDHWPTIHVTLLEIQRAWGTRREERVMMDLAKIVFSGLRKADEEVVQNAISNYEIVPGFTPHQAYRAVAKQVEANQIDTTTWLFNPIYYMAHLNTGDRDKIFTNLTANPISIDRVKQSLHQHPNLKLNVFAGKRDGLVPPTTFGDIKAALGDRVNVIVVKNAGHNHFLNHSVVKLLSR